MALARKQKLQPVPNETTLDPDGPKSWEAFRDIAQGALAGVIDQLQALGSGSAWQPVPERIRNALLDAPLPARAMPLERVYQKLMEEVLPYPLRTNHPRFFGWVPGPGTAYAVLAKMVAAAMNTNMVGGDHSAVLIESTMIRWMAELMGFAPGSVGTMTSGATAANMYALHAARLACTDFDVLRQGMRGAPATLTLYCSSETHSWVEHACEYLGFGRDALRRIPVDDAYRIDLPALRAAIVRDRADGLFPLCTIGNAGTINTGATDDLAGMAALSKELGLWFHVDGAFGALARLSPELAPQLGGLEQAHSMALDLHKWGFASHGVACALVQNTALKQLSAQIRDGSYLNVHDRGVRSNRSVQPFTLGIELSRPDRALEPWLLLQLHGAEGWRNAIEQNVAQARYFAERISTDDRLELMAPAPLNIVCFRVLDPRLGEAGLDALNQEVMMRVQESGVAVPSGTTIQGKFALRIALTNHRTQRHDLDLLLEAVLREARTILEGDRASDG